METIVIKIGGSTLGTNYTTAEDLVYLQQKGYRLIVVHGGGKIVNRWLDRLSLKAEFYNGLRVTDFDTLQVVIAILSGIVNKEIVSDIIMRGGMAVGLSGIDGKLIQSVNIQNKLGYVGEKSIVNTDMLNIIVEKGYIPVIAPIGLNYKAELNAHSYILNINGDMAAADIAREISADKLIFLTDVPGIYDAKKNIITKIDIQDAQRIIDSGIVNGGMTVKIKSCINALSRVNLTRIVDGRIPHVLLNEIEDRNEGTTIVGKYK